MKRTRLIIGHIMSWLGWGIVVMGVLLFLAAVFGNNLDLQFLAGLILIYAAIPLLFLSVILILVGKTLKRTAIPGPPPVPNGSRSVVSTLLIGAGVLLLAVMAIATLSGTALRFSSNPATIFIGMLLLNPFAMLSWILIAVGFLVRSKRSTAL